MALFVARGGSTWYKGGVVDSGNSPPEDHDRTTHHGETNLGALVHCSAIVRAESLNEGGGEMALRR